MINNVAVVARFLQTYTLEDMNRYKQPYKFDTDDVHNREPSTGTATEKKKILIVDIDFHQYVIIITAMISHDYIV
jgi:hypothetical protein